MNEQQQEQAKHWWIHRFVPTKSRQNWVKRINGLVEMTPDQKKKLTNRRNDHREDQILFQYNTKADTIDIIPADPAASWATGYIIYDPTDREFIYQSQTPINLFTGEQHA